MKTLFFALAAGVFGLFLKAQDLFLNPKMEGLTISEEGELLANCQRCLLKPKAKV